MQSAGPESTKGRRLKACSEGKGEEQGPGAARGEDLKPKAPVGWQPTAPVAGRIAKCRA